MEPGYKTLQQKMESRILPKEIKDLVKECHVDMRNNIGKITGALELAYRRGFEAGKNDAGQ